MAAWLPLAGVRVADFSMFVPGPFCSAILADLGAEVIKIEPPKGDPGRGYVPVQFRTENRNKRSIAVDLKNSSSRKIIQKLAEQSDIAIEGFRPGVAKRLGIDGETLRAFNPKIICCSISGYGQTGPWRERPGHDVNYVAAAGALAFPGQWLKAPSRSSLAIADMGGGSFAAIAILSSLYERSRTGKGANLDLSLFEAAFFWAAMRHSLDPKVDPRAHIFPVNDIFETADGKRLTLGILEEHFWKNFVEVAKLLGFDLSSEDFSSDQKRRANGDELSKKLSDILKLKSAKEWLALCAEHDVPVDLCVTPGEAVENEQIQARKDVAVAAGESFATFPVFADGARGGELRRGVPRLGEHTREILVELKFDDGEIAQMVSSGCVTIG
ncbi:MAG TPA: CaiB/BaiF CoA-transferase family protein [Burkholderiales bacterium]|jgi:crotonobetainyl-CoA:carnitine CoA-transferase CaiB-like acyl-CoA transferase|nr:CaiB/BaiF CoA-transferase family protein [Burkholderiales bacterium]